MVLEVPLQPPAPGSAGSLLAGLFKPLEKFMSRAAGDPFYALIAHRNFKPDGAP